MKKQDETRGWAVVRQPAVLRRGVCVALSRWLAPAHLRSLLGRLEPRSLFSVGVRAAGGGRAEPLHGFFLGSFARLQQLGNAPHYHLSVSVVPRRFPVVRRLSPLCLVSAVSGAKVAGTEVRILCRKSTWIPVLQWLRDNQKCLLLRPVGL